MPNEATFDDAVSLQPRDGFKMRRRFTERSLTRSRSSRRADQSGSYARTARPLSRSHPPLRGRHSPRAGLEFYVNLGILWISEKRPDLPSTRFKRQSSLRRAASRHTSIWPAHSMIGNYADALSSYRKAIELEPDNPETLTRLAAFLDLLGVADAAARNARERPR